MSSINLFNGKSRVNDGMLLHSSAEKVAQDWLMQRLDRGTRERFSEDVKVTKALADAMLVFNSKNRPITRAKVQQHSERLRSGQFILTHQGIAFSRDGMLNDGQHRLTAISETGIPGSLSVTFGCERVEFSVVDQGKSRTGADLLSIKKRSHAVIRSALLAWLITEATRSGSAATPQAVARLDDELPEADIDAAVSAGSRIGKVCNPTAGALAYYAILRASGPSERLDAFFSALADGANLDKTSPVLRVREWLVSGPLKGMNNQGITVKRAAAIIHAWNAKNGKRRGAVNFDWNHVFSLPEVTK